MRYILFLLLVLMISTGVYAQGEGNSTVDDDSLALEVENNIGDDMRFSDEEFENLEEGMIAKEVGGRIIEVFPDGLIIQDQSGKEYRLIVDAETLIYVDDEKQALSDVKQNDDAFAYYIEERDGLKCDWLEVSR